MDSLYPQKKLKLKQAEPRVFTSKLGSTRVRERPCPKHKVEDDDGITQYQLALASAQIHKYTEAYVVPTHKK